MNDQEIQNLVKKVRRRVVAFLNQPTTTPQIIVKVAKICGVKIPTEVNRKFGSEEP